MRPIRLCCGGGGVDGAIHRAGGPAILAECRANRRQDRKTCRAGKAVITTGGRLAAKYVIHTVGPVYRGGEHGEAETLGQLSSRMYAAGRRA